MAGSGTFTISGSVNSLLTGSKTIGPLVVTSSDAVAETRSFVLAPGDNTIDVPDGAVAMIVVPDPTNANDMTLKGDAADDGIAISGTLAFLLALNTVTDFVLENLDLTDDLVVQIVWL